MEKTNFFLSTLPFSPWGSFSHMVACRSSLENTRKINIKPVLNKTSPHAHTKSELDVHGVPGKAMEYVIHLSKRRN
jgi:hypothetical protein